MMHMTKAMFKRSAATVGLITLLWILSTLMIPSSSHAAILFDTDFETCAVGTGNDFPCEGWDDGGQERLDAMEVVSGDAFSGSKFMRHFSNGPGTVDGGNTFKPSIYHGLPGMEHLFYRTAIRISAGAQICQNGHTKLIRVRPSVGGAGYPVLWFYWRYGSYQMVMESPYDSPSGGWSANSGITPRYGQWDQVEIEYKLNTPGQSNGLIRVWINGFLRIETLNRGFRGPTPTSKCGSGVNICPSFAKIDFAQVYNQCLLGTIDYDRIAVGDTRIGPMNAKQTSTDSIPPAGPQGFQVH